MGGGKKPGQGQGQGPKKMTDEEQALHNHQMKSLMTNLYQFLKIPLPYDILNKPPMADPQVQAQPQQKAAFSEAAPSMNERIEAAFQIQQALERIQRS